MTRITLFIALLLVSIASPFYSAAKNLSVSGEMVDTLIVRTCDDFTITGDGGHSSWTRAPWNQLVKLDSGGTKNATQFKMMYSSQGVYVLFEGDDQKITTKNYSDQDNIFNGDVYEVFFHTDPEAPVYYEYEVNALGKELALSISSLKGYGYMAWIPRRNTVKKEVRIRQGKPEIDASLKGWTAEIFFPYGSLGLMPNMPPSSGTTWRANFCRLDYDTGAMVKWSWSPSIKKSFHELEQFNLIRFE